MQLWFTVGIYRYFLQNVTKAHFFVIISLYVINKNIIKNRLGLYMLYKHYI